MTIISRLLADPEQTAFALARKHRLGWRALCDSPNDAADRARFIETYDALARQARERDVSGLSLVAAPETRRLKRGAA